MDSGCSSGLSDHYINELSTRIGSEWPLLGVNLGFCQAQLDQLQIAYPRNVPECIVRMLTSWRDVTRRHDAMDSVSALSEALRQVGRVDLAQEIKSRLEIPEGSPNHLDSIIRQLEDDLWRVRFYHDDPGEKDKLVAQTQQCIARWRERNRLYVVTQTWRLALETFIQHRVLNVVGNSGDGKSTLAYYILSTLADKGHKVLNITTPDAIEANYSPGDKVAFLVDDAFGTPTVNNQFVEAWIRLHDKLRSFHEGGDFGLIITSRTQVLKSCYAKLENYEFYIKHVIDLGEKANKLSEEEKKQMLEQYCSDKGVVLTTEVYDQIKTSSLSGFPMLCMLYATDTNLQQTSDFFRTPLAVLNKQLHLLAKVDPVAYCGLVLILTHDGNLPISTFDVFSITEQSRAQVALIKEACAVETSVPLTKINEGLETLVDVYVTENDDTFSFIHDSVFDATTFVFGEMFPKQILKICSPKFLHDRVRSENARTSMYSKTTIKEERGSTDVSDVLFIPKRYCKDIAIRFVSDIQKGYLYEVFNNPSIFDVQVQDHVVKEFSNMSPSDMETFMHRRDRNLNKRVMHFVCHQGILSMAKVFAERGLPVNSEFLLAACNQSIGHECVASLLIENGVDINEQPDSYGVAAIHVAAAKGNAALVGHLIKLGADIHVKNASEAEAIHLACQKGSVECVHVLLTNGADPKTEDTFRHQPIHFAADLNKIDCLRILVENGADILAKDAFGFQAIHLAAQNANPDITEYLIELGADITSQNNDGRTPLHYACSFGRSKTIHSLIAKGASLSTQDCQGRQPLHAACASSDFDPADLSSLIVESNINSIDKNGMTPLHHACRNLHMKDSGVEKVKLLLQAEADIHARDDSKMQALAYACESNSYHVAKYLLDNGADVQAKTHRSRQAIHYACANGNKDLVTLLIDHGADPAARSADAAKAPIHFACRKGALDVVGLLLDVGVDVNVRDEAELTPLFYACYEGCKDLVCLLLCNGADPDLTDYKDRKAIDMLRLRPCDAELREILHRHSQKDNTCIKISTLI